VPLLAVAYNPVRPEGGPVVGCQLLEALSSSLPEGTPLWDVLAGRVEFAAR
jgi:hypothetical protein